MSKKQPKDKYRDVRGPARKYRAMTGENPKPKKVADKLKVRVTVDPSDVQGIVAKMQDEIDAAFAAMLPDDTENETKSRRVQMPIDSEGLAVGRTIEGVPMSQAELDELHRGEAEYAASCDMDRPHFIPPPALSAEQMGELYREAGFAQTEAAIEEEIARSGYLPGCWAEDRETPPASSRVRAFFARLVRICVWGIVFGGTVSAFYLLGAYHGFQTGQAIFWIDGYVAGDHHGKLQVYQEAEAAGVGGWAIDQDATGHTKYNRLQPQVRFYWKAAPATIPDAEFFKL